MSGESENVKYIYRLPPCPAYDVAGMESWLESMAEQGLLLCEDGFWFGIATFRQAPARRMIYRLEAIPKGKAFDDNSAPDEEAQQIAAQYGWEYVTRRGEFDIYRTGSEDARELNTDPAVQALAMKAVRSRQRGVLFEWLFWLVLYPLLRNGGVVMRSPILTSVTLGLPLTVFSVCMLAWLIGRSMVCVVQLERMYRRLKQGEALEHRKDWQFRARRHQVMTVVRAVLVTVWIIWLAVTTLNWMAESNEVSLEEYTATHEIPFVTVSGLAEQIGEVRDCRWLVTGYGNTVQAWSEFLSPVNIDYCEIAEVTLTDGRILDGGLYVDYHETVSPWVASRLAREYHRIDQRDDDYKLLEVDLPDVDFAVAYLDELHWETVVLQKGNTVIHASFHIYGDTEVPLEMWAAVLADSLK